VVLNSVLSVMVVVFTSLPPLDCVALDEVVFDSLLLFREELV
jgi:hypothetical protein